jgi:hypothetical protein
MSLTNPNYKVSTTFSAKNISSAASVYQYTADGDYKLIIEVYLDGVAGSGDYVAYLTKQLVGAGTAYPILPKTTATAAAGETAFGFWTMSAHVKSGDVLQVMIDGLAGDTSVSGKIRIIVDSYSLLEVADVTDAVPTTAEIWANATRTLTQTAAEVAAAVAGSTITITRGDTLSASLTGLGSNTGYVSIDFTVKYDKSDSDNDAILRIRKNASGLTDGLLRLNQAALVAPVVAADGSITVDSATALTIALAARATDDLPAVDGCYYDIQLIFAASVQTITEGVCNISADVTRAIA